MGIVSQDYFEALASSVCTDGVADRVSLHLRAEDSEFVRFNRAAVRQATRVGQAYGTVAVARGARRIESTLSLTGRLELDRASLLAQRAELLALLPDVPDDPYLLLPDEVATSHRHEHGVLPSTEALVRAVAESSQGLDFVGFYAGGPVVRAFADSRGTRHWHHVESFHFEWCLYLQADQALKTVYAGTQWDAAEFARRVAVDAQRLPLLAQPTVALSTGSYRAYFAPAAMAELLSTLGWGGFSGQARRTGTSPLSRLEHRDAALHPSVQVVEDTARGIAPAFTADGFAKPSSVALVQDGRAAGSLNSPRSARQYGLPANGANGEEAPEALSLSAGSVPEADVLRVLDDGLYVSNLWYLNYSDRQACRMTGMTRFACFRVEGGRLTSPLPVMRFDDSFLRLFGEGLVGLTDRAEFMPESSTYKERQLASLSTPGAIVEGWRLTL